MFPTTYTGKEHVPHAIQRTDCLCLGNSPPYYRGNSSWIPHSPGWCNLCSEVGPYIAQNFFEIIVWHSAMKKRQQSYNGLRSSRCASHFTKVFLPASQWGSPFKISYYLQTKQDEKRLARVFHKQYRSFAGWPLFLLNPNKHSTIGFFFQACVLKCGVFHHQRHPSSSSVAVKLCLALHPEVLGCNWDIADILCRWWFLSQILWDYVWCCWISSGLSMVGFSMVYVTLNCHPIELENDFT